MKKRCLIWMAAAVLALAALTGCGREKQPEDAGDEQYAQDVDVAELEAAVAEKLGENYWPDYEISEDLLTDIYGISPDLYEAYAGKSPMISANVDTLLIVKAKEGKETAVKEALQAYHIMQVEDSLQYPMNVGKVQAGMVEEFGRYICFVQLGGDAAGAEDDEAVIKACKEDNETALEVIETALTK